MSAQRKAEKNRSEVHALAIRPENRECADCTSKSTPYVILNFGTFVCTFCAGVHRSHQFRVKGISMSNFSDDEVSRLKKMGGNKAAMALWRASWDRRQFPKPRQGDDRAIQEFIRRTYVDKRWYREEGDDGGVRSRSRSGSLVGAIRGRSRSNSRYSQGEAGDVPVEPISKIIRDPAPIQVQRSTSSTGGFVRPRRVSNAAQPPKPHSQPQRADNLIFDDFGDNSSKKGSSESTGSGSKPSVASGMDAFFGGGGGDDFTPDWDSAGQGGQPAAQKTAQKKATSGFSLADELFSNIPPPQQQQPQWGQPFPQQAWGHPMGQLPPQQQQQQQMWGQMPPQQQHPQQQQNFGGFPPQQPWGAPNPAFFMQQAPNPWMQQQQQQLPPQQDHNASQPSPFDDPFGTSQSQQQDPPVASQKDSNLFSDLAAFGTSSGRSTQQTQQQHAQKSQGAATGSDPFGNGGDFLSGGGRNNQPNPSASADNPFDF